MMLKRSGPSPPVNLGPSPASRGPNLREVCLPYSLGARSARRSQPVPRVKVPDFGASPRGPAGSP